MLVSFKQIIPLHTSEVRNLNFATLVSVHNDDDDDEDGMKTSLWNS
jgi:hypothetical protein